MNSVLYKWHQVGLRFSMLVILFRSDASTELESQK